jgi:hypothetical protein
MNMTETVHQQKPDASRFKDKSLELLRQIEYVKVTKDDDLDEIFKMRYDAYRREGLISEDALRRSSDEYDFSLNAHNFAVYFDGELVSALRIHYANSQFRTCPTKSHFPGILEPYFDNGISFIDSSRFCTAQGIAGKIPQLPLFTTRLTAMACLFFDADFMLSVVRAEHSAFYRRFFHMTKWASGQKVDWFAQPVDLYAARYQSIEIDVLRRLPFFRSMPNEREALFGNQSKGKVIHVQPTADEALELLTDETSKDEDFKTAH